MESWNHEELEDREKKEDCFYLYWALPKPLEKEN
jgi:hypothetical protein